MAQAATERQSLIGRSADRRGALFGDALLASPMLELLAVLPLASIVWGNLAAMRQPRLRRMMAYGSIAHAGYLFYALLGNAADRTQAVLFYLLAYGLLILLVFAALPPAADDAGRDRLDNLKGLFHRAPFAALMIGIAMLSLAGIPPFPGFVASSWSSRTSWLPATSRTPCWGWWAVIWESTSNCASSSSCS